MAGDLGVASSHGSNTLIMRNHARLNKSSYPARIKPAVVIVVSKSSVCCNISVDIMKWDLESLGQSPLLLDLNWQLAT